MTRALVYKYSPEPITFLYLKQPLHTEATTNSQRCIWMHHSDLKVRTWVVKDLRSFFFFIKYQFHWQLSGAIL